MSATVVRCHLSERHDCTAAERARLGASGLDVLLYLGRFHLLAAPSATHWAQLATDCEMLLTVLCGHLFTTATGTPHNPLGTQMRLVIQPFAQGHHLGTDTARYWSHWAMFFVSPDAMQLVVGHQSSLDVDSSTRHAAAVLAHDRAVEQPLRTFISEVEFHFTELDWLMAVLAVYWPVRTLSRGVLLHQPRAHFSWHLTWLLALVRALYDALWT